MAEIIRLRALACEQAAPLLSYEIIPSNRPPGLTPDSIDEDSPTDGFEDGATPAQHKLARLKLKQALHQAQRQGVMPTVVYQTPSAPRGGI